MNTITYTEKDLQLLSKITTNKTMELIIFPTESCNFRCTYCYENFKQGKMKKSTVTAIKKLIKRRAPQLDLLYIQWFGGEPLLASDIILEISEYIKELCKQYSFVYRSSITTNGYLLNEQLLRKLASLQVTNYQISLDGPREIHNMTRITARKEGTFDEIWHNLLQLKNSDIQANVLLRLHFKQSNVDHMRELILLVREQLIEDSRFSVFFKGIAKLGGSNDETLDIIPKDEQSNLINEFYELLYGENYKAPALENPFVCYAAKPNSFLIRANGDLAKCTVALYDSRNKIGYLDDEGHVIVDSDKLNPWLRGVSTLDSASLACPLKNLTK